MQTKPKRKLKNIDFSEPTSHIALVSKNQGGPASGANYSLVLKNVDNPSPEFIQKMQAIQVTMTIPDFLERFFMLWEEDVEFLSQLLGYVEPPEDEQAEGEDNYNKWVEERFQSFSIIKSLHDAKSLPEALSKLTEQDYLDILTDQEEIEKALAKFDKKSDDSTKVEKQVEVSASKLTNKNKDKNMTQATAPEMVEKSALTVLEKAMDEQKVQLQKALDMVKAFEEEKKQAVIKSKTDAVTALVKDAKQAEVLVKAALALDTQEDFEALVGVVKALVEQVDKSDLFKEVGASASADETKTEESSLTKLIKSKFNKE